MSIRQKRYDTTRYRFGEGDRVRTISKYEGKPFSGIVMFFRSGFVLGRERRRKALCHSSLLVRES